MADQPNVLIICIDQWDAHMELPEGVELPALRRLMELGVTLDRHYCTVPICTPSRASMWTGLHAKRTPLWDNTNFAWIDDLPPGHPTIGSMMREQGYYTAFKGKWHLNAELPHTEDALEPYGFADYQQWGDMWGTPLEGAMLDGTAAFETVDWLRHKRPADRPWLLISSLVNPHDTYEGADNLYESSEGTCIAMRILTSSDEVSEAEEAGTLSEAVAATPDGSAGVVFGGTTSVNPDVCAADAEDDLASLDGQ